MWYNSHVIINKYSCLLLERSSLKTWLILIIMQIQKNYYSYVPPTGYQQNLNPFMALRTPVQDMNGTQLNGQIK